MSENWYNYTTDQPNGIAVFDLEGTEPIYFTASYFLNYSSSDSHPITMTLIAADGAMHRTGPAFDGFDQSTTGGGTNVAYVSVGSQHVRNPPVINAPSEPRYSVGSVNQVPTTNGTLVLAWADQLGPFTARLHFFSNTTAELAAESNVAREIQTSDFDGGVSAGVSPAGRAQILGHEALSASPGILHFAYITYLRGELVGEGAIKVRATSGNAVASLDAHTSGATSCACLSIGHVISTSENELDIDIDYVGEGRTQFWGIVADLPVSVDLRNALTFSDDHPF